MIYFFFPLAYFNSFPGNAYPVTERPNEVSSLRGGAIKGGYQSHYVATNAQGEPSTAGKMFDEIIVSQDSQVFYSSTSNYIIFYRK